MKTLGRALLKLLGVAALEAAPVAVSAVAPWAGPIVQSLLNAIFSSEKLLGGGTGDQKRAVVTVSLAASEPMIEAMLAAHGKTVENDELFAAGLAKVREGLVDLSNATSSLGGVK